MPDAHGHSARLCVYDTGSPYGSLTVQIERPVSSSQFRQHLKQARRQNQIIEMVPGLGDRAFIEGTVSILVLVGDTDVIASVQHAGSTKETEAALTKVGETAVQLLEG